MSAIEKIHAEIDELSDRRTELWHLLSEGRDPVLAEELKQLEARLEELWGAHRGEVEVSRESLDKTVGLDRAALRASAIDRLRSMPSGGGSKAAPSP